MKSGLSMTSRAEVTTRYARSFRAADKRTKGRILDEVVSVTGWSRDNARRRLTSAAQSPPGAGRSVTTRPRKQRATKFSYDALKVLQRVSAASIDRYLRPAKATDQIRGVSTTKPSPLLRSSIKIRKAGDEVEAEPGFFEGDTVAHCGPTLKGEFARTLNLTCVHTGWVFTRTMRNNAHAHVLAALQVGVQEIPFTITGFAFDNGTKFLHKAVITWSGEQDIYFTLSRPYEKHHQATIESKNNHLVRKYGFYYRYDTSEERHALNRLWKLVNDRFNYLTPTKKPVGWGQDKAGRRKRLYDKPQTPLDRLLAAGALAPAQERELIAYRDQLNPAAIAREIADIQAVLLTLAKDKTEQLYLATVPTALPDVRKGIRIKAS